MRFLKFPASVRPKVYRHETVTDVSGRLGMLPTIRGTVHPRIVPGTLNRGTRFGTTHSSPRGEDVPCASSHAIVSATTRGTPPHPSRHASRRGAPNTGIVLTCVGTRARLCQSRYAPKRKTTASRGIKFRFFGFFGNLVGHPQRTSRDIPRCRDRECL